MLKITLITVGRLKEQYLRDAVKEYEKRLSTLCTLKNVEIDAAKLPDNPNPSQIATALEQEAEKILAAIPNGAFVMPMCIEGKQMDSEEHKKYTGVDNKIILENAQYLKQSGIPHTFHTPLIPNVTDRKKTSVQ